MKPSINVGPVNQVIHLDDEILICGKNASISSNLQQGYFIADTRLVSGYRLHIGRTYPQLLSSSEISESSGRFEFTNSALIDDVGLQIPEGNLHLRLDRILGRGLHEDYELVNYFDKDLVLTIEISIESDFADIFDVKLNQLQRRGQINSDWNEKRSILSNLFINNGFARSVQFEARTSGEKPAYANGGLSFQVALKPREKWSACLLWRPIIDGEFLPTRELCHHMLNASDTNTLAGTWVAETTRFETNNSMVDSAVNQAIEDLINLRVRLQISSTNPLMPSEVPSTDMWVPAAGVPWFVSIFGRDSLITSLQAMHVSYKFAEGSLRALSVLQATETDDNRDMQPGKIQHELRRGELAQLGFIPHTPYYGTHDATPLFVLTTASTWDWHGDKAKIDLLKPHVDAALAWIDRDGDIDGDGIQEYSTRSVRGYFNQGWKDDGTAIVHADGTLPVLPIATIENQGIVIAAKRAWAKVLEEAYGEKLAAQKLYDQADRLQDLVDEKFYWADQSTYYLGLDGNKRPIESVASNAGQLMYYGAIYPERSEKLIARLFEKDMWSGWGIRTLSSDHPSYNPFSYQWGSVWPHDNVLIAAGMRNYGFDEHAHKIVEATLDAAECFAYHRLPELFSGLERDTRSFPVQYLGANVPQAWAAGAVVQIVSTLLGLEADAKNMIIRLRPSFPTWLKSIKMSRLAIGNEKVNLAVMRSENNGYQYSLESAGPVRVIL